MTIGIIGLGYVGLTTAASLLSRQFKVVGYETSDERRAHLQAGLCPVSEPGVENTLVAALANGTFSLAKDITELSVPDLLFICVGTPNQPDGSTDLRAVQAVFGQLAAEQQRRPDGFRTEIVLRSTVPPGTLKALAGEFPTLFATTIMVFYPEFLREGTAMRDFLNPPQTVLGVIKGGPRPGKLLQLMSAFGFECEVVDSLTAEALKLACNAFHALKVAFGNEVGRTVAMLGGDGMEVMRMFIKDTILNVSPRYLLPGTPYGGSCLPKDTRAFAALAAHHGVMLGIIDRCEASNRSHLDFLIERIASHMPRRVAVLGLAFKKDTDDIRESASVALVRELAVKVESVTIHDFLVQPARITGGGGIALRDLLRIGTVTFCEDLSDAVAYAELVVVMQNDSRYLNLQLPRQTRIVDVVNWKGI